MKKIIINTLKVISWILIYFLNFLIVILFNKGTKYILPLVALISGPILFLLWRYNAESETRYLEKMRKLLKKQELYELKKHGLKKLNKQTINEPKIQDINESNTQALNESKQQELSELNRQALKKSKLEELYELNQLNKQALNKSKQKESNEFKESSELNKKEYDSLKKEALDELKRTVDPKMTLEPDHHVRNIILIILAILIFVVSSVLFTKYKVQILARIPFSKLAELLK